MTLIQIKETVLWKLFLFGFRMKWCFSSSKRKVEGVGKISMTNLRDRNHAHDMRCLAAQ